MGTKKTTDGTVGLTQNGSTTYYTYAKDVVVFRIEDDEFNTSSINSVRDSDDAFKAIVKDGEVVALFITENGKDGGNLTSSPTSSLILLRKPRGEWNRKGDCLLCRH